MNTTAPALTGSVPALAALRMPTAFRIVAIEQDNYRTKTFELDGQLDASPGQFVMAWLPRFDEKPFSLVSASPIRLMITAVGPFTRLAHSLAVGDRLWLRGPFGQGFVADPERPRAALVAGGYGVAPLYWLAQTFTANRDRSGIGQPIPNRLHAILGARGAQDLLYAPRFQRLFDVSQNQLHLTTNDGSQGTPGLVTDVLAGLLDQGQIDVVYACGPDPMLAAVEALCVTHQVPAQLSWEAYMRCGIGLCGSCEHSGRLLCMDGHVLPSR
jgi:dihydroorotate dehydrogenase electron transfer subunit